MADHPELVAEIPKVEKMTVQERLEYAKRRRSQQLRRWERKKDQDSDPPPKKKSRKPYKARFEASVMLLESSSRGDSFEVRKLLESGIDPNLGNDDGLTALHQACIDDNEDIVELLLRFGANVDSVDKEFWTPLHAAAACGNIDAVEYLIDQGANIVAINADGSIPLDLVEEDEDLKDFLKDEMDAQGYTEEKLEELRQATEMRMLEDMKSKVENDEDIDEKDHLGATPLHIGAANGYDEVVEYLLDSGADIDAVDNDGWEPIHAAACWGQERIIELLVIHGADLESRTPEGETPYDLCEDSEIRAYIKELKKQVKTNKLMIKEARKKKRNSRTLSVKRTSLKEKITISQNEAKAEAILRQHPQLAFLVPNAVKMTNGESSTTGNSTQPKTDVEPAPDDHRETKQTRSISSEDMKTNSDKEHGRDTQLSDVKLDSVSKEEERSRYQEKNSRPNEPNTAPEQVKTVITKISVTHQDRKYVTGKDRGVFDQDRLKTDAVGPLPDQLLPRHPAIPSSDHSTKSSDVISDVTISKRPGNPSVSQTEKVSMDKPTSISRDIFTHQSTAVSTSTSSKTTVRTKGTTGMQEDELPTSRSGSASHRTQGRELPTLTAMTSGHKTPSSESSAQAPGATSHRPQERDVPAPRSGSAIHGVFAPLDTSTSGSPESFHTRRGIGDKASVTQPAQDAGVRDTKGEDSEVRASQNVGQKSTTVDSSRGSTAEVTEESRPKLPSATAPMKRQAPQPPVKEQKVPHPSPENPQAVSPGDVSISTDKMEARYTTNQEKENRGENRNDSPKDKNKTEVLNDGMPANDQVKIVRQKKTCCVVM